MMSVGAATLSQPLVTALVVISAAFVGSLHCAGMCGPLIASLTDNKRGLGFYFLARALSYSVVGALAGWLGSSILKISSNSWVALTVLIMGFVWLLFLELKKWTPDKRNSRFSAKSRNREKHLAPAVLGLATPFIPCAWLYSAITLSAASTSYVTGGSILFSFALGTTPGLIGSVILVRSPLPMLSRHQAKLLSSLLSLLAMVLLIGRWYYFDSGWCGS